MTKKVLIISALFFGLMTLASCLFCKCPKASEFHFQWTDVRPEYLNYEIRDSMLYFNKDTTNDFRLKNYALNIGFGYELVARMNNCSSSGFFSAAYACKCSNDTYRLKNIIQTVSITTLTDFDSQHLSGSDITDLFGTPDYTWNAFLGFKPFSTLVFDGEYSFYSPEPYRITAYLLKKPSLDAVQRFEVTVHFQDGSAKTAVTANAVFR